MIKLIDTVRLERFRDKLVDDTVATSQTTYSSDKVDDLFDDKQDVLTAGMGITIERVNDTLTISAEPGLVVKLGDVSGATANSNMRTITLKWSDPNNVVVDNVTLAQWAGTKVVKKVGSAPNSIDDGTLIVDNTVKNQYSVDGLTDNVSYGSTYYYRFFPYTSDGIVTEGSNVYATPTRTVITVPTQNTAAIPVYDGTTKTASWNNYDSSKMTVTGNTGVNAGSYTATFTPLEDYCWSGGSTSGIDVSWSIAKAAGSFTLSSSSVTLDSSHNPVTVSASGTGEISVTSSDSNTVQASYSNGVITIGSSNEVSGNVTVTVSVASSGNYEATSGTISVTASFLVPKSWDTATDAEIVAMVVAADAGNLDLSQYWAVGQSRNVKIGAISANSSGAFTTAMDEQTVEMVLMNVGYRSQSGIHFVVGTKNMLNQYARMNSSNTNEGSWNSCSMKTDLNNLFYNAIKSYDGTTTANFKGIFKTFNLLTAQTYNGTTNQTTSQKFALFAEKEVFGSRTYSNTTEANALSQIEYYKTSSNRVKYNASSSAYSWWERSPGSGNIARYCHVNSTGGASYNSAANSFCGVAPFGCI